MNKILIVDNNPVTPKLLIELLDCQGGFIKATTVTTSLRAIKALSQESFDLLVVVNKKPSVDGSKIVAYCAEYLPSIKVIILAQNTPPIAKASSYNNVIFLDQNHDINMLAKRVVTELHIEFGGRLTGIHLSSFLQMTELDEISCTLQIQSKNSTGYLWVKNGDLIAAKTCKNKGRSAALDILSWQNVSIDINYAYFEKSMEINERLIMLIIESGKVFDETLSMINHSRKDERYELAVTIDFGINNVTRQCLLRDISLSGAYIETNEEIDKGDSITLSLISADLKTKCLVLSTVVHKDCKGVGVRFSFKNENQQKMVQLIIDSCIKYKILRERPTPIYQQVT